MKKLLQAIVRNRLDMVIILGGAAIAVGTSLIYVPAGLIVGGVLAIVFAVASDRGGGDEQ